MEGIAGDTAPYGSLENSIKRSNDMEYYNLQVKYVKYI